MHGMMRRVRRVRGCGRFELPIRVATHHPQGKANATKYDCRNACKANWWLTLLQIEFLDTRLIWSNGSAFDTDRVLLNSFGSIESDLVVRLVTVLEAQIVILEINVEVGEDELVLDVLPDNTGHLVAVELDDGVLDLDLLRHVASSLVEESYGDSRRPGKGEGDGKRSKNWTSRSWQAGGPDETSSCWKCGRHCEMREV